MKDDLESVLRSGGACLVGYADLSALPPGTTHGFPRAVSIAVALEPAVIAGIAEGPTPEYFDEYNRANRLLDNLGKETVAWIEALGCRAKHIAPTVSAQGPASSEVVGYDPSTLTSFFQHKTAATLSGLGWVGKCALLITSDYGSAVRLTTVLTDAPLQVGKPVTESRCGTCTSCVEACPAHAPSGRPWSPGLVREDFFDAFACRDMARKTASARIGISVTVCGMCINACPHTRKYLRRSGYQLRPRL